MSIFELRDHIKETLHPTKDSEDSAEEPISLFLPRFLTFIAPKKASTKARSELISRERRRMVFGLNLCQT